MAWVLAATNRNREKSHGANQISTRKQRNYPERGKARLVLVVTHLIGREGDAIHIRPFRVRSEVKT